ncbi:gamma-glutamylcyclotransferase family protein [Geminicoccus harenae]|uniref:gamma-glutamylcyclotransferase family protein n=1 Tax=Geminicoccus harenae TaxID=2498453 RepID=UPI00168ACB74|nr:gamma-glutamylcyclotransferase [Geminicoccus harenae]
MTAPGRAADEWLATYGSLAPGEVNHHQLAGLAGRWMGGTVRGRLMEAGWGAALGFPGLVLDPDGQEVPVHLFHSPELPGHWPRLDAFEGNGYRRVVAQVDTADGPVEAWIYVLAG